MADSGRARYGSKKTPLVARERGPYAKSRRKLNYIWVSEPWPFGVVMHAQVPLVTYFHACAS